MKTRFLLLAALIAAPAISVAQSASAPTDPASLVVCADEKDNAARLACYDWQAARQRAAAKAPATTAAPPVAPVPAPVAHVAPPPAPAAVPSAPASAPAAGSAATDPKDPNYGLQGSQLVKAQGRENAPKPPKPQPLVAAVTSVKQYGASEVRVTLENGQVWQQTESRSDFWLRPGETVTITPGVLGSFFLMDDQHQRIRVKRIL